MIRPATLLDVPAIYRLERQIFPKDAYPYLDLALLFLTPGFINLKAVNEAGELVGYVCGGRSWLSVLPSWIITLGVAHAYQRQGIGRHLLGACEARLTPRRILLTVRRSNSNAQRLYQSCGYEVIQVKHAYYNDGEDGLVMELKHPAPAADPP